MSAFDDDDDDNEARFERLGDVLIVDPVRIQRLKAKGSDARVSRIRVYKWVNGTRGRVDGEFPPDQVTATFLRNKYGAGIYEVTGVNSMGQFIASTRVNLENVVEPIAPAPATNGFAAAAAAPAAPGVPAAGLDDRAFMQQMVLALIARPQQPAGEHDSMRDAVSSIVKLIALQVQVQAQAPRGNDHPPPGIDPLLAKILERALTPAAAPARSAGPTFTDMLPVLQLGLGLGSRLHGGNGTALANPEDPQGWMKIVPELADTVGVPLILSIAQGLLPPERAKQFADAVGEHMRARQAEAEADVATAEADES